MPQRRIFISATSVDLKSDRELASVALRRRGYVADAEAVFNLTHLEIDTKLESRIADCDADLCLIGFLYGGEPTGRPAGAPRRLYIQLEFDIARRPGKPVYLLLAAG